MAFLVFILFHRIVSTAAYPSEREDVIGQYTLANENQCNRLCWYRQLCTSYSYNSKTQPSKMASAVFNCILHTDSAITSPANDTCLYDPGWKEEPVSAAGIDNGCKSRPCSGREVCVPTSALPDPGMRAHSCLPIPSRCDAPISLSNGYVNSSENTQDDAAVVTCDVGYVASPKGVPLKLKCLVTSYWTKFEGSCAQYEFHIFKPVRFIEALPWDLNQTAGICIKGIIVKGIGQVFINLGPQPSLSSYLHFKFQYAFGTGVFWNVKNNDQWQELKRLGEMPLIPGDSFNLTVRLQNGTVVCQLNVNHTYTIAMDDILFGDTPASLSHFRYLFAGDDFNLTYINMISGC